MPDFTSGALALFPDISPCVGLDWLWAKKQAATAASKRHKPVKMKVGVKIQQSPNISRYSGIIGADGGNRTHNLLITSEMLCHWATSAYLIVFARSGNYESTTLPIELHQHVYYYQDTCISYTTKAHLSSQKHCSAGQQALKIIMRNVVTSIEF